MPWLPGERKVDCFNAAGHKIKTVTPNAEGTFDVPEGTERFVSMTEFKRITGDVKVKVG